MNIVGLRSLVAIIPTMLLAAHVGGDTRAVGGTLEDGSFPEHWIDGTDCDAERPVQIHAYNDDLFILRQSLCTDFEAPFIYLIFGEDRVLMQDTGAGSIPIRAIVDDIISRWLDTHDRTTIELIVSHSHSHGDHVAGDSQFSHGRTPRSSGGRGQPCNPSSESRPGRRKLSNSISEAGVSSTSSRFLVIRTPTSRCMIGAPGCSSQVIPSTRGDCTFQHRSCPRTGQVSSDWWPSRRTGKSAMFWVRTSR